MANHCILPGCNTVRYRGKTKGREIFILQVNPYPRLNKSWQENLLQFCYKYREKKEVWEIAKKNHAGICELHFKEEDFRRVKGKKHVKTGTMPSLLLPEKSHETPVSKERPVIRKKDLTPKPRYMTQNDLIKPFLKVKRPEWTLVLNYLMFRFVHQKDSTRRAVDVGEDLSLSLHIDDHVIDWDGPSFQTSDATLCSILDHAESVPICKYRYPSCSIVVVANSCLPCEAKEKMKRKKISSLEQCGSTILPIRSPLGLCTRQRLEDTTKARNRENKRLSIEVQSIRKKLRQAAVEVPNDVSVDIQNCLSNAFKTSNLTPYQKLMWTEQVKLLGKKTGAQRYHPEVIRLSLSLYTKSPTAYNDLRGVLTLPCKQTLLDFRYAEKPQSGFSEALKLEICKLAEEMPDEKKYVFLAFDEMQIMQGLVFDKVADKLIGFVDYGLAHEGEGKKLATHVLGVYLKSISGDLSILLTYFPTVTAKAHHLTSIFWNSLRLLEESGLKVMALCCDGSPNNRKLFSNLIHGSAHQHKIQNPADPSRHIFLWPDPPHLLKTARNSMLNDKLVSPEGPVKWSHIRTVYMKMSGDQLHQPTKLTRNHLWLSSCAKMSVKLAAQVLSASVARVLVKSGYPATAKYARMFNKFFDICNASSGKKSKGNPDKLPFTAPDDDRLTWLMTEFLPYLSSWKTVVSNKDKFIAKPTFDGLSILIPSIVELTKYLLTHGKLNFVCLGRVSQDCLERYFGHQRAVGRSDDNPTVSGFGFNSKLIETQRTINAVRGNVHCVKRSLPFNPNDEILPKRRKQ